MATSVGERTHEREHQEPPDWAPVGEQEPTPARRHIGVIARGAIALAFAALFWWLGHRPAAIALIAVATVLTTASLLSPAFARRVDRVVAFIERVAGRALSLLLIGGLQLLVFAPLWLILRIVRHDPLALGATADGDSFWRPVPRSRRSLYQRPFAYERLPRVGRGADSLPLPRLRAVIGLLALLLLLDIALGAAVDALDGDDPAAGFTGLTGQDVPAAAGEPWRVQLSAEINAAWENKRFDPYLGWAMSDVNGEHVNVSDGVRRSYEPPVPAGSRPLLVDFFGGSAMFGVYQRDEHTIPSELARLAEADGIPVRVQNRGTLAYVNWQETEQLEQLASAGSTPDLAVFYDGFNEVLGQFQLLPHARPTHLEAEGFEERVALGRDAGDEQSPAGAARDAWADVSLAYELGQRLGVVSEAREDIAAGLASIWAGDQSKGTRRRGRYAAAIHARGVDIAQRLARSYGFRAAFFWQPFLYSKRVVAGEEQLEGWLGSNTDAWTEANRVARAHLAAPVQDLSAALDGVERPVMYDFVHTNELGARVIARALYERLRPELRQLARERRP